MKTPRTMGLPLIAVALCLVMFFVSSCWDDDCPEGCPDGTACFYGVCLSRQFCPVDDPNADNCAQYEGGSDGLVCSQRVDHGICREGYRCACESFTAEGRCRNPRCVLF